MSEKSVIMVLRTRGLLLFLPLLLKTEKEQGSQRSGGSPLAGGT